MVDRRRLLGDLQLGAAAASGGPRRRGAGAATEVGTDAGRGELRLAPVVTVHRHHRHDTLLLLSTTTSNK